MGTQILRTSRGIGISSSSYRKYNRPDYRIDLPSVVDGDEVIHMLVNVYPQGSNYLTFRVRGDYQVDWGDGNVTTHSDNTQSDGEIQYSGVSSTTDSGKGFRQAIVTITPQVGSSLTSINMNVTHPDDTTNSAFEMKEVRMAGQNFTTLSGAFRGRNGLELFEYVGSTPSLTNLNLTFYQCFNLQKVVSFDTSNVTIFTQMLSFCSNLLEVPKFNLSSTTNTNQMFSSCSSIEYIEPWDLDNEAPSVTGVQSMFSNCTNLQNVPFTSASNVTNFSSTFASTKIKSFNVSVPSANAVTSMFSGCGNLVEVTSQFPSGITNTTNMFFRCNSLTTLQPFDTTSVTTSQSMFRETYMLKDLSSFNFSASTNMSYMFFSSHVEYLPQYLGGGNMSYMCQGADYVRELPEFKQPITSMFSTFQNTYLIEEVPTMDVSNLTDLRTSFSNSKSISVLPNWDLSSVTSSNANTFQGMSSLRESNVYGLTKTHSYRYCQLDRDAIVNIFNNLGTASSQTITISNNPGSGDLTPTDIAIATGKGWTVVS